MLKLFVLFIFVSCASRPVMDIAYEPNKKVWIGRSADDVLLHPEYAVKQMTTRKASDGSELITFKNSGGVHSSGGCYTLHGVSSCSGNAGEIVCNHLFLIKKGIVTDYYRNGACGDEQLIFRPRDKEGNPILTENELKQFNSQRAIASESNCSLFAKALRSQSCR